MASKTPASSKTLWAGIIVTLTGALPLVAEFWSLLDAEQLEFLKSYLGPEAVMLVGIVMIALRLVTSTRIGTASSE